MINESKTYLISWLLDLPIRQSEGRQSVWAVCSRQAAKKMGQAIALPTGLAYSQADNPAKVQAKTKPDSHNSS